MAGSLNRKILAIALPSIVSNITVPLLGLVDTAIVGHMGSASCIGAVAVGSMVFNVIYWVFGFLRMGTSGMVSQALGRRDLKDVTMLLSRSLSVGLMVAAAILLLQVPVRDVALAVVNPSADIRLLASSYFDICVWGAPAMLGLSSLSGWFIGMQNTRAPMAISIMQNIVNIAASLSFVYVFGMQVEGVALGTVVAQYAGFVAGLCIVVVRYGRLRRHFDNALLFARNSMGRFFKVNADIFVRTLCLVAVNFFFLSAGAKQGAVVLAVNTLLMQLFTLFSYVMDGFAYAGEALCGKCHGAGNAEAQARVVRRLFGWGAALAAAYTAAYALVGTSFLSLLTDNRQVISASAEYLPWTVAIPAAGMAAFVWDGVFIGLTRTRAMLVSSAIAALSFFAVFLSLRQAMSNHALWLAFIVYLAMRGIVQTALYPSAAKA